jgi:hypothetical protein
MVDGDIRRGDQHRFPVRPHIEAIFAVVVARAGWPDSTKWHRLHKQMEVDLVDGTAAEGQFANEAVDVLVVTG